MHAATLAQFQDDFIRALRDPDRPAPPAFAVYRNTVMKGCIDALQANYPAVARLVGEEWFRAAAAVYVREHLPRTPMLLEYGAGFADFLARFEPAAEPARAEPLYLRVADGLRAVGLPVETGRFGADMAVDLVNDGPVTFWIETRDGALVK